jgi:hypothetical protein
MTVLSFTITPAGVGHIHDLLSCLARFDENVSLEASPDSVSFRHRPPEVHH